MSTDPNSGIAYITMYASNNGQLSDGEQFSGVLIAPDEILTVAHGVTEANGGIRTVGTAYLGHDGGALTGGVSVASVYVLDGSHTGPTETDGQIATDFAVIHLSQPVMSAATFALGVGTEGTYTVTGYPAANGGSRTSMTEALSKGSVTGELTGRSMLQGTSSAGASGSPVYETGNAVNTVHGLDATEDRLGNGSFLGLTTSDITQIKAWVYSDDSGQPWGSDFAPSPSGPPGTTQPPADRLATLAAGLGSAAQGTGGPRGQIMADVATALSMAHDEGYTAKDATGTAQESASLLGGISGTPRAATAYMAGVMAGEAGIPKNRILSYIANTFGLGLGGKTMNQLATAGFTDERSLALHTTSAPIAATHGVATSAMLGDVLRSMPIGGATQDAMYVTGPDHRMGDHLNGMMGIDRHG